jgi:hypothetical protein
MEILTILILVIAVLGLVLNAGYISHELGVLPHGKDRSSPADRKFPLASRYDKGRTKTHAFQVFSPFSDIARQFGHAEVYKFSDPYQALETAIRRYEAEPSRSRYDDLIHLSNYICNHVRCDERINALIGEIHQLIHKIPLQKG